MMRDSAPTRNDTVEFGRRTRNNLEFIERSKAEDFSAPVHVVTQLTLSLLGIVVFPYERFDRSLFDKKLADMEAEGWLGWSITLDQPAGKKTPTNTLQDLLWHLRNAVAHGRLTFTSDSADINEVAVFAEDKPNDQKAPVNWRAEIHGPCLRIFCLRFLEFVDRKVS